MSIHPMSHRQLIVALTVTLAGCASTPPQTAQQAADAQAAAPLEKETVIVEPGRGNELTAPVGTNIKKRTQYRRGGSSYSIKTIGRKQIEEQGGATADDVLKSRPD